MQDTLDRLVRPTAAREREDLRALIEESIAQTLAELGVDPEPNAPGARPLDYQTMRAQPSEPGELADDVNTQTERPSSRDAGSARVIVGVLAFAALMSIGLLAYGYTHGFIP